MDDATAAGGRAQETPRFTEEEQEGLKAFWAVYEAHQEELATAILEALPAASSFRALMKSMPEAELEHRRAVSQDQLRNALIAGEWAPYLSTLRSDGANYARTGIGFSEWYHLLTTYRRRLVPLLIAAYGAAPDLLRSAIVAMDEHTDIAMATVGEGYLDAKQDIILQHQVAIRELSTPVLQVRDQLLILPIIGVIDSHRAQQLTEALLRAIRAHRARVVVIDITGVPTVDSMVANHLLQTAEAARLMGASSIITGLSADIAQTLVRLGVDASKLVTAGDLQSGLEEADRILRSQAQTAGAEGTYGWHDGGA